MFFSIIVPIYNTKKYLDRCVTSILNQSFPDFELILIDDGSTDGSGEICDKYKLNDSRVRVEHINNSGVVFARNTGLLKALGEYVAFIDSDDFIGEEYLELNYQAIKSNLSPQIVVNGFSPVDKNGNLISNAVLSPSSPGYYEEAQLEELRKGYIYDKKLNGINYGNLLYSLCTKIVKRKLYIDTIEKVPTDLKYGEDMLCTQYLITSKTCTSVLLTDNCSYFYRQNPTSATSSTSFSSLKDYSYTVVEMDKCQSIEKSKTNIYAFRALVGVLSVESRKSKNLYTFVKKVKQSYKYEFLWNCARNANLTNGSIKDMFKIMAIKYKMYFLIYLYNFVKHKQ